MHRALLAVFLVGACSKATPAERTTRQTVPIDAPAAAVAPVPADAAAIPVATDASGSIDAANAVATCGPGWRAVSATLRYLTADDRGATLCSTELWPDPKTQTIQETPERCARFELATGAFTEQPAATATAAVRAVTLDSLRACKGTACVALDVPPADAAALAETDQHPDLDASGSRAVVVLPVEKAVGVFDAATGKRTRTLAVTAPGAGCVAKAFFIGDVIYASARGCDDLDFDESRAWIFAGPRRTSVKPLRFGELTRTPLAGDLWAVASLKPYRVDFIDGATGVVRWSVPLPGNEYDPRRTTCCLALGVTAFGTLMHDVSPLARVGTSSVVVAVAPRTITWIDPVAKTTKVVRFPPCPPQP